MPQNGASPKVAIVVLNWNGWQDTASCVCSLQRLDYPSRIVMVVDNGSTDGSVERLRAAFPELTILETGQNVGFARGNNVGIRHALGLGADYVWLLNNDTTVDPGALSAMVDAAEADPRLGAVGAVIYSMDRSKIQAWGGGYVNLWTGTTGQVNKACEALYYISGASMLLRRQALLQVGLFDERFFFYWEDTDLSFRLRRSGWRIHVQENAIVRHVEGASVGKRSYAQARHYNRGLVLFMRKHAPFPVVPATVALIRRTRGAIVHRRWDVQRGMMRGWLEGWVA